MVDIPGVRVLRLIGLISLSLLACHRSEGSGREPQTPQSDPHSAAKAKKSLREIICGLRHSTQPTQPPAGTPLGFETSQLPRLLNFWKGHLLLDNGHSLQTVCRGAKKLAMSGLFANPLLGQCVGRFEVRENEFAIEEDRTNGPHGSNRAELREKFTASIGQTIWYGLSTFIPSDFPIHENRLVIAQWRATDDPGEDPAARSPVLAHRYVNGTLRFTLRHSAERIQKDNDGRQVILYEERQFPRGRWHDFVHQVRWSHTEGLVRSWINGRQVINYRGPVGYNDAEGPSFKWGLYRDNVPETYVIYHDNYRRGNRCEDVVPGD